MLGKTHVVGSLAVAHVGLIAYTKYRNSAQDVVTDGATGATPIQIVGPQFGESVSLLSYMLMAAILTLFVLLLLRVGNRSTLCGYAVGIVILLLGLKLYSGSDYPLAMTVMLLLFALGSLLPDIDSEKSTLGRYVQPISRVIPHRTITHTIWVVGVLAGFSWYLESYYLLALTLGYTLHIAQDSFSRQGICWFYPIVGKYSSFSGGATVKQGRKASHGYRTGGTGETIMFYAAIGTHVLCVGFVVWNYLA